MLRRMKPGFLIDTDTASDDAVALIMALRHPDVQVLAITTVAGNVPVKQASSNALYTAELCGADVPIYVGAEKPLTREHRSATWFHGQDGLGECGYATEARTAETQCATDAIIETIETNPGLVLVTLGPLTNVAKALQQQPEIATKVSRCVVMGGAACCEGNVTPAAEYNIWCDPDAARIVIRSGLPVELVSWHLCRGEAVLSAPEIQYLRSLDNPVARFAIECNRLAEQAYFVQTGEHGICLPDPVAMTVALEPGIVTAQSEHFVEVETESKLTQGATIIDRLNVAGDARNREVWADALAAGHKAKVIWGIDNVRWKQALYRSLG